MRDNTTIMRAVMANNEKMKERAYKAMSEGGCHTGEAIDFDYALELCIKALKEQRSADIDEFGDWLHSTIGDGFVRYGGERNVADNDVFESMFLNESDR